MITDCRPSLFQNGSNCVAGSSRDQEPLIGAGLVKRTKYRRFNNARHRPMCSSSLCGVHGLRLQPEIDRDETSPASGRWRQRDAICGERRQTQRLSFSSLCHSVRRPGGTAFRIARCLLVPCIMAQPPNGKLTAPSSQRWGPLLLRVLPVAQRSSVMGRSF
jgi:hypothetical protein